MRSLGFLEVGFFFVSSFLPFFLLSFLPYFHLSSFLFFLFLFLSCERRRDVGTLPLSFLLTVF